MDGSTVQVFMNGTAVYDALTLTKAPNSVCTVSFLATNGNTELRANLDVSLRSCVTGEVQTTITVGSTSFYSCTQCPYGTYSLDPSDKACKPCMENAQCPGGDTIDVKSGYWRQSSESATVRECYVKSACLGGSVPEGMRPLQRIAIHCNFMLGQ